ncbi:MAG: class I SAM-dependent methyltransferase [Candidatus Hermodarchaeota archaeon]
MDHNINNLPLVSLDYWSDFARELAKFSNLKPNGKILDVGTGTGACLVAANDKLGGNCHLVGIDRNGDRLSQARDKFKNIDTGSVKFHTMEASNLDFEDNSFDNILSGFIGFSDSYDFEKNQLTNNAKMKEIFRVLKPEGEAAFSTWAFQQDIEVARGLLQQYLRHKKLKRNDEIEKLSISYSKESVSGFKLMMKDAGFNNIRILPKNFKIIYKSVEEWWEMMKYAAWIMRYTLNQDSNSLKDLKKCVLPHGIQDFEHEGTYIFQKTVIFAYGSK